MLSQIQSIKQKMIEAGHIQRQYRTMIDVINAEKVSFDKQLHHLEKSIADLKIESVKLKVLAIVSSVWAQKQRHKDAPQAT